MFPLIVVETRQGERGGFFPLSLSFPVFSDNDMIQYDIMRYCYCTLSYLLYSILCSPALSAELRLVEKHEDRIITVCFFFFLKKRSRHAEGGAVSCRSHALPEVGAGYGGGRVRSLTSYIR